MKDNIIINMISKVYFSIISLFVFIFLLLFIGFIVLQNGLFITEASISNIHIKQLYIKWNEKLDVSVAQVEVTSQKTHSKAKTNYKNIGETLKNLTYTTHWFNSLIIERMTYKDVVASFKYHSNDKGFLVASSKDIQLNATLSLKKEVLNVNIEKLYNKKINLNLNGNIYVDTKHSKLYTNINVLLADELNLTLYAQSDTQKLQYCIASNKKITDYKDTIALVNLPKEAKYWAYDAIKMSSIEIKSISGFINYMHFDNALKNIYVSALVDELNYTYHKKLDAIHTKDTLLKFKNGVLFIYPHHASSYKKDLGRSWLKIDFTKKEELLTLHLLFDALLDKDMLKILNTYKIKLPILQKKGKVHTDLTIAVGLRNIDIDARGTFYTQAANFDYLGLNVDIYDANIVLNNYDVSIKNMQAQYKDIAKAGVSLAYNASTSKGIIDFNVDYLAFKGISLDTQKSPLHVQYNITNDLDFIDVENSKWLLQGKKLKIDTMKIPFDLQKLTLQIPASFVELENISNAFVSGFINLKEKKAKFNADVLKFSYEGIELSQSNAPLLISYDKKLSLISKNKIFFNIAGSHYIVNDLFIEADQKKASLKHTQISIGKYIKSKVYANFDYIDNKSHISLSNFTLTDPNTKKLLYKNKKILLSLTNKDNILSIDSKELDGEFSSQKSGWKLKLNSIGRIAKNSKLLKHFHLNKGDITIYKNRDDKYTRFKANVSYPYQILVKNNKPLKKYKIKGKIYKQKVHININKRTHITIKDSVDIEMDNASVNIMELIRAAKDMSSDSNSSKLLNVLINAKNSSLYVNKNRSILYDTLDMQYYNKILTAQLTYRKSKAGLKLEKKKFHLYGKNFNDKFMNKLFALSKFKGGVLDFSLNGDLDDYTGVIYINKTTINDYKTLNNILAFVNTVPSLVTFQLPSYSNEGLYINKAYINFKSQKSIFNLTDIYLDSKEIDILGKGTADLNNDNIDIVLNLKTDLGSDLSKVPVVGYILLDGNSISTTLSIKGKASDPTVKTLLAEEIVVAPLNIIKRTLSLPYRLIKDAIDNNTSK